MLFPDVNICVMALRPDASDDAEGVRTWLEERLAGPEQVGISEPVLSAMVRIATHHRIFESPSAPAEAIEFADAISTAPSAVVVRPGPRHWRIFRDLVISHRLRANDVPDAYLGSLALEHGATFVTRDRGFERFAPLRTLDPLD